MPLIQNYREFREPFVGGGSIFLAAKQGLNKHAIYEISDLNYDLYCFWKESQENMNQLSKDCFAFSFNSFLVHFIFLPPLLYITLVLALL